MKLYNLQTKVIEDVDIIVLKNGNQIFPHVFTDEGLIENGYKRVVEMYPDGQSPKETEYLDREYSEDTATFTVKYVIKPLPLHLLQEEFKKYVQAILDDKAKEKGYDNIVSACSYAGYDNEFRQEGELFGKWRARVWSWGFKMLADIQAGKREIPKTFKEAVADMPTFE